MQHRLATRLGVLALCITIGCKGGEKASPAKPAADPEPAPKAEEAPTAKTSPEPAAEAPAAEGALDTLPTGLLLAYSQFQVVDGKATAKPMNAPKVPV